MNALSVAAQQIIDEAIRVAELCPEWTAHELSPYLSGRFSAHTVPFGPKRVVVFSADAELLRTKLGWTGKPLTHEPLLSTGRADYRDILVGDSE